MTTATTSGRTLAHPEPADIRLEAVLHALADPMRMRVVRELAREDGAELSCSYFALPVTKSTSTHHFRVLRESGVIRQIYRGTAKLSVLRRATWTRSSPASSTASSPPPPARRNGSARTPDRDAQAPRTAAPPTAPRPAPPAAAPPSPGSSPRPARANAPAPPPHARSPATPATPPAAAPPRAARQRISRKLLPYESGGVVEQ